jgi:hypothetical protein
MGGWVSDLMDVSVELWEDMFEESDESSDCSGIERD